MLLDIEPLKLVSLLPLVYTQVDLRYLDQFVDGRALFRVYLQHLLDYFLQVLGVTLRYAVDLAFQDLLGQSQVGLRFERRLERDKLVHDTAHRPNVRLLVVGDLIDLLRTHVIWRADVRCRQLFLILFALLIVFHI